MIDFNLIIHKVKNRLKLKLLQLGRKNYFKQHVFVYCMLSYQYINILISNIDSFYFNRSLFLQTDSFKIGQQLEKNWYMHNNLLTTISFLSFKFDIFRVF